MMEVELLYHAAVELQRWLFGVFGEGEAPVVSFGYAPYGAHSVSVGERVVYCSESTQWPEDDSDPRCFQVMRDEYLRQIGQEHLLWKAAADIGDLPVTVANK